MLASYTSAQINFARNLWKPQFMSKLDQIGSEILDLCSSMHAYTKRTDFFKLNPDSGDLTEYDCWTDKPGFKNKNKKFILKLDRDDGWIEKYFEMIN